MEYISSGLGGHCGPDHMVVGFMTTYAISAYHHFRCEFKSRSGELTSDRSVVFSGYSSFFHQ